VNTPLELVNADFWMTVPLNSCTVAEARFNVPALFFTVPLLVKYAGLAVVTELTDVLMAASLALNVTGNEVAGDVGTLM